MEIIEEGGKKTGKVIAFECICGCKFRADEIETIPISRYGQHDEYVGTDYHIRCPKCSCVVSKYMSH